MKVRMWSVFWVVSVFVFSAGCSRAPQSWISISEIEVNAPVEKVFSYYCAIDDAELKILEPALKISNRHLKRCTVGYSEDDGFEGLGMKINVHAITTEVVPNQRVVWKATGDFYNTATWLFVPEGNMTRLINISEYTWDLPRGISYKMVKRELEKASEKSAPIWKERAEKYALN